MLAECDFKAALDACVANEFSQFISGELQALATLGSNENVFAHPTINRLILGCADIQIEKHSGHVCTPISLKIL